MTTKATLYLDSKVFRALKVKAALTDKTVSQTANDLISQGLSDAPAREKSPSKVKLIFEGRMGFPVLTLAKWPEGEVFDRENIYD